MRKLVVLITLAVACKSKTETKPAAVAVGSAAVVAPAAGSAATPAAKPARPVATNEQLAAYKTHMKAGWALQRQKKWAEAVPEFEAAAKVLDGDQRAVTELGWSAMGTLVEMTWDVKLADDGTVTVTRLDKGQKDEQLDRYVGSHKLW